MGKKGLVIFFLILIGCTTTKTIMVPSGERKPNVYEVYQTVLDTFQELTIPVEFQDPPYSLESIWMYWPPHTANKIIGFPLTWWKYRAIIQENTVILEAEGRGISLCPLTPLILVNFTPAPIDWVAKALQQNLKTMDITVKIHIRE
ncbi:MAG TPA: hypothetical protein ENG63_11505 [Candidatus Desulfofervidus auxilii]|uniref:Lipoprotein n=1 Tax=Desulfofervidus auxilii TaxID=1621989 RepID=A0A7C0Y692_DESA2|nr:hypothetical protein [Candidatus Desulfofervidus auxilii]HDD45461.1 hypothetical protein [Candidatus Desulfofervidus auxilii]